LSLYDPTALRIEVPVRESLLSGLHSGTVLQVRLESQPDLVEGTVDEIVPQAEAGSRTFLVKVGLPRREGVYTGSFGRVIIPAGKRERLLVPAAAVERIGQLTFVTTVDEERRASRRLVTLGPAIGDDHYEVLSGLRAGENVLLR
jgi:multidrug efflux pump subunit AcrA (membrane-fusion protein)